MDANTFLAPEGTPVPPWTLRQTLKDLAPMIGLATGLFLSSVCWGPAYASATTTVPTKGCFWSDTNPPQRIRLTPGGKVRTCYLEVKLVFRPTEDGKPWELRSATPDRCTVWVGDAKQVPGAVQACQDATLTVAEGGR